MPVIPHPDSVGDGVLTGAVDDVDGEVVKQDEIALEEKIVGEENVTLDEHGPGPERQIHCRPHRLQRQRKLSVITLRIYRINRGVHSVWRAAARIPITDAATSRRGRYLFLLATTLSRSHLRIQKARRCWYYASIHTRWYSRVLSM